MNSAELLMAGLACGLMTRLVAQAIGAIWGLIFEMGRSV